ncbi:MAG: bifunctional precorrin-2 dehydrogenase/sirohydrochlorin ferrochelatase [Lachnospiraceae bacterium]
MKKLYFPLFVDISQKEIVVAGGGKVAERRVNTLLSFTEHIKVVSPELTEGLHHLAENGQIVWLEKLYESKVLEGADIVLAATDDASCNEQIVRDCRKRGILVNTAHKKELCDFYFPAVDIRENIVIGINASGINHKQVKQMRKDLETIDEIKKKLGLSEEQHE